jgi:hypothetical protein
MVKKKKKKKKLAQAPREDLRSNGTENSSWFRLEEEVKLNASA